MREQSESTTSERPQMRNIQMAITSRVVVTVSADTPIYVVLEQAPKVDGASGRRILAARSRRTRTQSELRQLLQLKRE